MGDAQTSSLKVEIQTKMEEAFIESLIEYLYNPTDQTYLLVNERLKNISDFERSRKSIRELKNELQKFIENDYDHWKEFNLRAERLYFEKRPDLKKKFLAAAQIRSIGALQWVI